MSKTFELSPSALAMRNEVTDNLLSGKRTLCDYAAHAAQGASSFFFACLIQADTDGTMSRLSLDGNRLSVESRATLKAWREAQGIIAPSQRDEATRVITLAVTVRASGLHDWRNAASRRDLRAMAQDKALTVTSATESAIQDAERLARADAAAAAAAAALVAEQHQREQADAAAAAAAAALVAEQALQAQLGEIDQLRTELASARTELASVRTELASVRTELASARASASTSSPKVKTRARTKLVHAA